MNRQMGEPEFYCLFDTAIGTCGVAWSAQGLTRLQLPEASCDATERRLRRGGAVAADAPLVVVRAIAELQRYFKGEAADFSQIALDLRGVDAFERRVYDAARLIGWGKTLSYGELARRIGDPTAARAVGQALGRNPIPVIVPCHRILAAGHRIGGFSAPGGADTKQRLLALEGVYAAETPLLPGLFPARRESA